MADKGMSVSEAARLLGVGVDQVRKLIYSGKLAASKGIRNMQSVWQISSASVESYKEKRRPRGAR